MSDYIDRQVAIKDVYAIHTVDTEYEAALIDRLDVRYVLEALPSADVEPVRHGRWMWHDVNGVAFYVKECSACGWVHALSSNYLYCPNCGARMDGEQDG